MMVRTKVSDTGIGMSQDYLTKIFEPFTREQSTTKSKVTGTGLGMSIVKHLVDEMGGTITVESKKGVGTTFTVTLLFEEPKEQEGKKIEEGDESADLSGMRVLLAEDNELNREILKELIRETGISIEEAVNGTEAYVWCRTIRRIISILYLWTCRCRKWTATRQPDRFVSMKRS